MQELAQTLEVLKTVQILNTALIVLNLAGVVLNYWLSRKLRKAIELYKTGR